MAWAYGVSRNAYIDHVRAAKTRRVVVSDDDALGRVASDDSSSAEALVAAGQQADHLAEALEKLPPAQRQAYELRHVNGLEVPDAAAKAGVSENAFKIRVHRAKEALRHALHLLTRDDD